MQKHTWRREAGARRRFRPGVEALEDRLVPAVIRVTHQGDNIAPLNVGHAGTLADPFLAASLRSAILSANDEVNYPGADTIVFDSSLASIPINLSLVGDTTFGPSALPVSSIITIAGTGETITRDVATPLRLFYVTAAGNLTLDHVTLSNGLARGGKGGDGSSLSGGGAAGLGGAILNQGVLKVTNSTLTANKAVGGNGGNAGAVTAGGGGGGGLGGDGSNNDGNSGGAGGPPNRGAGGGSNAGGPGGPGGGGGGGFIDVVAHYGFLGGDGGFGGGGGGGTFSLDDAGGDGGFGGGGGGNGNGGFGGGGGGPSLFIGTPGGGGGGAGLGGAIFNQGGTVALTNATLSGNVAQGGNATNNGVGGSGRGGALFNYNGTVTLLNSTLANNTVASGTGDTPVVSDGGSVYNLAITPQQVGGAVASTTLLLYNSILAESTMPAGAVELVNNQLDGPAQVNNGVPATSKNVVVSSVNLGNGTLNSTSFITTNPNLAPLLNNGGLTFTHALAADSSAANAGANNAPGLTGVSSDQRDLTRLSDGTVDIGAFEIFGAPPPPPPPSPQPPPPQQQQQQVNAVMALTDVTAQVGVARGRLRLDKRTGQTRLWLRLTNNGPGPLTGPISFVLVGLPPGIKLRGRTGLTSRMLPGSAFQDLPLGPAKQVRVTVGPPPGAVVTDLGGTANQFLPGETRPLRLTFGNPSGARFRFQWRILAGVGVQ